MSSWLTPFSLDRTVPILAFCIFGSEDTVAFGRSELLVQNNAIVWWPSCNIGSFSSPNARANHLLMIRQQIWVVMVGKELCVTLLIFTILAITQKMALKADMAVEIACKKPSLLLSGAGC